MERGTSLTLLGPDEAVVRAIGLGEDRVLSSTPSLRVVARLTGSKVDEERRLSDGRLAVALLLGAGKETPALNAALHAVGRMICTPQAPKCSQCPVTIFCPTSDFNDSKTAE